MKYLTKTTINSYEVNTRQDISKKDVFTRNKRPAISLKQATTEKHLLKRSHLFKTKKKEVI